MRIIKAIGVSIGIAACFFYLGCGSSVVQQAGAPSISTVSPQTITAGTSSVTMKVVGTNFTNAVLLWNGTKLTTTVIDATTLGGVIAGGGIAVPGTAQLQVQNSQTGQASQSVPIAIVSVGGLPSASPLAISTTLLPSGVAGASYSVGLAATGGSPAYTWSITSGNLPAGLTLATATGAISGTPTTSGTSNFTATVSDSSNPALTQSAAMTIAIAVAVAPTLPPTATLLTIGTSALASGTDGTAYSQALQASGGTLAYKWSITSGSLPAGLTLAATTGAISGTPTVSGTSNFTASVSDSGNPVQTKSGTMTITVAPTAATLLTIGTSALASGTDGTAYSQALQASGGTLAYKWSITSGSLPAGLTLAATTGAISGTPTANGTFTFTASVSDSSSPVQTKSAAMTITVAAAPTTSTLLTIGTSALASGTDGTAYSQALQASGGTLNYTWSITSGSLPAGLTLASTTGTISGTPTVSGISTFTASVSDSSSPVQTKSAAMTITVAAQAASTGTTWYIRTDGGSNTQCTGTTNAPYPGSGSGQPCAFNHPYQMLTSSGTWASMVGGDTIQFEDQGPYYMGEENQGVGTDWSKQLSGICPSPNGFADACFLPAFPSGTASNLTRVIGANAGSCHNSTHTALVNPTVLEGTGYGVFTVLDVQGTNYVDISCIEVTQPDTCTQEGAGYGKGQCTSTNNYVGYAGILFEYLTAQGPSNLTLQDVAVVGTAANGILGSHVNTKSTDVLTASDVYIIGNGASGWNGDGGNCDTSCESVGTMNLSYTDIDWNGCMAVKPYNINVPTTSNSFNYCYDDKTAGYGDGFVQIAAGSVTLNVTHSMFRWNTQDGFDSLHLSDDVTTSPAVHISDSWSEGNEGQTFKLGAGAASSAINNVSISDCRVMATASNFPNNPAGWSAGVSDLCRAQGDQWAFQMDNGTVVTLENNTSVGYGTTMYDVECSALAPNCMTNGTQFVFRNNISKGYPDPGNGNTLAGGFYFGEGNPFTNAGSVSSFNLWNTMSTGCPDSFVTNETNYVCGDPLLAGESNINAINPNLTSTSPAIGAGAAISGITTDYNGNTRTSPPALGALEFVQ